MGGFVEDWFEKQLKKVPELAKWPEPEIASAHFFGHLCVTSVWPLIAAITDVKWVSLFAFPMIILVIVAEWGKQGRKIDFITRGLGWLVGLIPVGMVYLT